MIDGLKAWFAAPAGNGPLLRGAPRWVLALVVAALVVIFGLVEAQLPDAPPSRAVPAVPASVVKAAAPAKPRFDPAELEAMKTRFRAEPWVADLALDAAGPVEWQLGVRSKGGSEVGRAEVACMMLREHGLVDEQTDVRIVDLDDPAAQRGDFRTASRGHVRCRDGLDLGA